MGNRETIEKVFGWLETKTPAAINRVQAIETLGDIVQSRNPRSYLIRKVRRKLKDIEKTDRDELCRMVAGQAYLKTTVRWRKKVQVQPSDRYTINGYASF